MKDQNIIKNAFDNIPTDSRIFVKRLDEISSRIKFILNSKGWNQKDLAEKMDKEPSEISKWLNTPHNLTLKTISKLEATLGQSIINIPSHYHIEYEDKDVFMSLFKTNIPKSSEENIDEVDFTEPKASKKHETEKYVTANG